jgi:hypothetical protein
METHCWYSAIRVILRLESRCPLGLWKRVSLSRKLSFEKPERRRVWMI